MLTQDELWDCATVLVDSIYSIYVFNIVLNLILIVVFDKM